MVATSLLYQCQCISVGIWSKACCRAERVKIMLCIAIVKTVLFTIVNIISFVWVCSIYQFINTIIKKEHVRICKVMSMVFTTGYTLYDFIKLCQSNWQVFHKYPISLL